MTQGKNDVEKQRIRKKMEGILARAKKGEDFAKLAQKYTEDPGSKSKGGLYEDFGRGKMVKPFEDAAFSVPVGEISDIVETRYGYHILKVVDRKKETRPYDEVRDEIEKNLKKKQKNEQRKKIPGILDEMKKQAGFGMLEI
jgi:parvulin-like peptidyl-prolyl isomerase